MCYSTYQQKAAQKDYDDNMYAIGQNIDSQWTEAEYVQLKPVPDDDKELVVRAEQEEQELKNVLRKFNCAMLAVFLVLTLMVMHCCVP
jgi:hypothetical protein